MRSLLPLLLLSSFTGAAGVASANVNITRVSTIAATAIETFEDFHVGEAPYDLFNETTSVSYYGGYWNTISVLQDWEVATRIDGRESVVPQSGYNFLLNEDDDPKGTTRFGFGAGVYQFGGWFSDTQAQKTQFELYVSDGEGGETLAYSEAIDLISEVGELRWAGFASNVALSSVVITGHAVPMDDLVISTNAVPEPASMLALGLGGLALVRRRKA
ncbi:PEP-CTERM sorting domain-containing protein [bacterium]|nr:MAG: PEP-CTERM sorting domain-containing protein [bacterium]